MKIESDTKFDLPKIRGSYRENADLSKTNWFNVGGPAEILFRPADVNDLSFFLKNKPQNLDITILGVGSNLLIRDGGIKGVVIKLGREFSKITLEDGLLAVGAGCLNFNLANFCQENGIKNFEFLIGIPGSIGGSIAMNAGSYGSEISDILVKLEAVGPQGEIKILNNSDIGFIYRGNNMPSNWYFTKAYFKIEKDNSADIKTRMEKISKNRHDSQPVKAKTSGSSFKNPPGYKAWELIDKANLRGYKIGGASISEKHCNFIINDGTATAKDIEDLGEFVREVVKRKFSIELEWEIKIIGR